MIPQQHKGPAIHVRRRTAHQMHPHERFSQGQTQFYLRLGRSTDRIGVPGGDLLTGHGDGGGRGKHAGVGHVNTGGQIRVAQAAAGQGTGQQGRVLHLRPPGGRRAHSQAQGRATGEPLHFRGGQGARQGVDGHGILHAAASVDFMYAFFRRPSHNSSPPCLPYPRCRLLISTRLPSGCPLISCSPNFPS